ncbi:MAG: hypothetical protein ACI8RZ_008122 [Myxococcota bacterium]
MVACDVLARLQAAMPPPPEGTVLVLLAGADYLEAQLVDTRLGRSVRWETGVRLGNGIAPSGKPYPGLLRLLGWQVQMYAEDLRDLARCPRTQWPTMRALYHTEGREEQALELARSWAAE